MMMCHNGYPSICLIVAVAAPYRIELFKPHYILGPRPTWASVPSHIEFGSTFTVTLAANTTASDIIAVALSDQGTTTHSSNHATRTMLLAYTQADGQTLTVTAPANIHIAQPGFYLLFAVARDDTYSVGRWLRLKGPWGSRPSSLPAPSQFVATASTRFETGAGELSCRSACYVHILSTSSSWRDDQCTHMRQFKELFSLGCCLC